MGKNVVESALGELGKGFKTLCQWGAANILVSKLKASNLSFQERLLSIKEFCNNCIEKKSGDLKEIKKDIEFIDAILDGLEVGPALTVSLPDGCNTLYMVNSEMKNFGIVNIPYNFAFIGTGGQSTLCSASTVIRSGDWGNPNKGGSGFCGTKVSFFIDNGSGYKEQLPEVWKNTYRKDGEWITEEEGMKCVTLQKNTVVQYIMQELTTFQLDLTTFKNKKHYTIPKKGIQVIEGAKIDAFEEQQMLKTWENASEAKNTNDEDLEAFLGGEFVEDASSSSDQHTELSAGEDTA